MSPRARVAVRSTGEVLVTLGVVLLLFVAYELWFTGFYTRAQQNKLADTLHSQWHDPAAAPVPLPTPTTPAYPNGATAEVTVPDGAPSSPYAVLWIPHFGASYHFVIVNGVDRPQLILGPGHYPGTASPGQIGNMVISAHRTTHLHPFRHIDDLRPGDTIVVETQSAYYTYVIDSFETVVPTNMNVVLPVPDHPGAVPTKALITLTTCTPPFSASHRLIVHGHLDVVTPRTEGTAPALAAIGVKASPPPSAKGAA